MTTREDRGRASVHSDGSTTRALVEALCALAMLAFLVAVPLAIFMIGTSR